MTRRKFRYDVYSGANKRSVHVYEGAKKKKTEIHAQWIRS